MAEGGGSKPRPKPAKMTMEEYLNFIYSGKKLDLIVDHLNQIIDMHGFKRIHKEHKCVLIEAVNSIELMDPARSTVQVDGVSSDAFLSIDDVIKDLNELKWQECCVTSLQTLNAVDHHHLSVVANDVCSALTVASAAPAKRKRRRKSIRAMTQNNGLISGTEVGGSETTSCSSAVKKWVMRKKRSVNYINVAEIGVGSEGGSGSGGVEVEVAGETQP